jgi:pyruvate,water dikinase
MIGCRGACRCPSHEFHDGLVLECNAIKKVREEIGLNNVHLMIHFVRMVSEALCVLRLLEEKGLKRGTNGFMVMLMCEIPANALLAK